MNINKDLDMNMTKNNIVLNVKYRIALIQC